MAQMQELQAQVAAQETELQQYAENDPETLAKLVEATNVGVAAACGWCAAQRRKACSSGGQCASVDVCRLIMALSVMCVRSCAVRARGGQPLAGQHLLAAELVQEEV